MIRTPSRIRESAKSVNRRWFEIARLSITLSIVELERMAVNCSEGVSSRGMAFPFRRRDARSHNALLLVFVVAGVPPAMIGQEPDEGRVEEALTKFRRHTAVLDKNEVWKASAPQMG